MSRVRQTNQQKKGSQLPGDTTQKEYYGTGSIKMKTKSGEKKRKGAQRSNPY